MPNNIPPMASATGTPAPIEGAGAACKQETLEQTEGAACADAIPMTDSHMVVAKDFMCDSRAPNWPTNCMRDCCRNDKIDDQNQSGNGYYHTLLRRRDARLKSVIVLRAELLPAAGLRWRR